MTVAKSCSTLCDPMDYKVHGILWARILEWVAFPCSGDLPNPGIEPKFPALQADSFFFLQADSLPAEPQRKSPYMLKWLYLIVPRGERDMSEMSMGNSCL